MENVSNLKQREQKKECIQMTPSIMSGTKHERLQCVNIIMKGPGNKNDCNKWGKLPLDAFQLVVPADDTISNIRSVLSFKSKVESNNTTQQILEKENVILKSSPNNLMDEENT